MRHNKIDPYGCFGHEFGGIWGRMDDEAFVWPTERENLILQTFELENTDLDCVSQSFAFCTIG